MIRSRLAWSLFFLLCMACAEINNNAVTIQWQGRNATGLVIPQSLLTRFSKDSLEQLLHVRLTGTGTPVLGEYAVKNDAVVFTPLISFTRGLTYELTWRDAPLQQIEIPADNTLKAPVVMAIYPSGDSLPENLLKMYIVFSKPMQEGKAIQNISVIKNGRDTISSVFLDLDQELWNAERTVLKIWLDPGRIKRDLQPNKQMGAPLQTGNRYQVVIKPGWTDTEGASLSSHYRKDFLSTTRDDASPDPAIWTIHPPKAGTRDALTIELHEPLDYLLLKNAVQLTDGNGNVVNGAIETAKKETILHFTPTHAWAAGEYTVTVEPRLEDLAGNNLERPFDKDLLKDTTKKTGIYKRMFRIPAP